MIRSFDGLKPEIHEDAYVDPSAVVIGDVHIEADASVWPNVTLRGDHGTITIAEGANVQDNAVVHETTEIGPYSTIGHTAIVHNCEIGRRALIGMGATVLDGSSVGQKAIVGANSLVTEDTRVESETLYAGIPASRIKTLEGSSWAEAADRYVTLSKKHATESERLDEG